MMDSGTADSIPIVISEGLMDEDMEKVYLRDYSGCAIKVAGRSVLITESWSLVHHPNLIPGVVRLLHYYRKKRKTK